MCSNSQLTLFSGKLPQLFLCYMCVHSDLQPYTNYSVSVAAFSEYGVGIYSHGEKVLTLEDGMLAFGVTTESRRL